MMITKRKVIGTLDIGFDGCRHTVDYALNRLKKPDPTPSQLRWLARRCAIDLQRMDSVVWRGFREYLTNDETVNTDEWQNLLHFRK